ncbi:MAG: hypothetical protein OQK80_04530, partial [Sedimenticola sp.]|nr:hypothetical protein [Sedimenticola sp.]
MQWRVFGQITTETDTRVVDGVFRLKNCKLCGFSKACNSLPGICIILQYVSIAVLFSVMGYLFVTQE